MFQEARERGSNSGSIHYPLQNPEDSPLLEFKLHEETVLALFTKVDFTPSTAPGLLSSQLK